MSFGWGVGDIIAISGLGVKVYTAYKDAPDEYKHISDEVSLRIIIHNLINKAARNWLWDDRNHANTMCGMKVKVTRLLFIMETPRFTSLEIL